MKRRLVLLFLLVCVCHPYNSGQNANPRARKNDAGDLAPEFSMPLVRGGNFDLRGHRGRTVVLAFVQTQPDKGEGNPSRELVPMLESVDHQYRDAGVDVVLIDATALAAGLGKTRVAEPSLESLINTSYDWSLTAPLAADPGSRIARKLGVESAPTVILVSPEGRIVQRWRGAIHPGAFAAAIQQIVGGPMKNKPPQAQE